MALFEQMGSDRVQPVNGQAAAPARVLLHEIDNLRAPGARKLFDAGARRKMIPRPCRANFVDRHTTFDEMLAAVEFEQNDRSFDGNEHVTAGIVKRVHLHVCRARRISDIDWVVKQPRTAAVFERSHQR